MVQIIFGKNNTKELRELSSADLSEIEERINLCCEDQSLKFSREEYEASLRYNSLKYLGLMRDKGGQGIPIMGGVAAILVWPSGMPPVVYHDIFLHPSIRTEPMQKWAMRMSEGLKRQLFVQHEILKMGASIYRMPSLDGKPTPAISVVPYNGTPRTSEEVIDKYMHAARTFLIDK